MDMIYTDAARRELGVLQEYELDLAIGEDENDFALTMARASHCCAPGAFVYAENTEYGGIVDALRSRPAADEITYTGRTWHGILNSKVIEPDSGEDYLTVSGDANEVILDTIGRLGLSNLFRIAGNVQTSPNMAALTLPYSSNVGLKLTQISPSEFRLTGEQTQDQDMWFTFKINAKFANLSANTKYVFTCFLSGNGNNRLVPGVMSTGGWICNAYNNAVYQPTENKTINYFYLANSLYGAGEIDVTLKFYYGLADEYTGEYVPAVVPMDVPASGITITDYRFPRYCKGYDGIRAMLAAHGAKLVLRMQNGMVTLSAAPAVRLEDADTDDASVSLDVTRAYHTVNHLICLGRGELAARTVLHLYADATGSISTTKTQTGLDEITEVYDYPSVESVEDLEQKGRQKLAELWQPAQVEAAMDASAGDLDVGDSMRAIDEVTGIEVAATITKKIVTVRNGRVTVDYKVGV